MFHNLFIYCSTVLPCQTCPYHLPPTGMHALKKDKSSLAISIVSSQNNDLGLLAYCTGNSKLKKHWKHWSLQHVGWSSANRWFIGQSNSRSLLDIIKWDVGEVACSDACPLSINRAPITTTTTSHTSPGPLLHRNIYHTPTSTRKIIYGAVNC
jgi:hypothetical protein